VLLKWGVTNSILGKLLGKLESLGFDLQNKVGFYSLSLDVIKSLEIEGEFIEKEQAVLQFLEN